MEWAGDWSGLVISSLLTRLSHYSVAAAAAAAVGGGLGIFNALTSSPPNGPALFQDYEEADFGQRYGGKSRPQGKSPRCGSRF